MSISATVFKAECLRLMDEVARTGQPVVITKHGRPVAQLAPVPATPRSLFGYMRNTLTIKGDIVASARESWSADSGEDNALVSVAEKTSRARRASMRMTIRLDDALLDRARREAARRGVTLTLLIEQGLERMVTSPMPKAKRRRVSLPVCRAGGGMTSGVDLDDSAALLDRVESRD
jgi:prevent-host-death family protein